jgi:hypothetical protein
MFDIYVAAQTNLCRDLGFTILFTVEAAMKIFAFGFKPYWCITTNKVGGNCEL